MLYRFKPTFPVSPMRATCPTRTICLELRVAPTNYSALQEASLLDRHVMMIEAVACPSLDRGSIRLHGAASQETITVTVSARNWNLTCVSRYFNSVHLSCCLSLVQIFPSVLHCHSAAETCVPKDLSETNNKFLDIWRSHSGYYDAGVILGYGAVWFRRSMPTFRRNTLSYKLSTFQLCHFSPKDIDSMFLRNVGIDLRNHTAT
jgi:hypothetical protein